MILDLRAIRWGRTTPPPDHRLTSQCLEIAEWTHADCLGGYCSCECHKATS